MPVKIDALNRIASQGEGSLSPLKRNNFRVSFAPFAANRNRNRTYLGSAATPDMELFWDGNQGLAAELLRVVRDLATGVSSTPWEAEFSPQPMYVETRNVIRSNMKVKYAGWLEMGDATLSVNSFQESNQALFFICWLYLAGGISRDAFEQFNGSAGGKFMTITDAIISRATPDFYKTTATVRQYGDYPTGVVTALDVKQKDSDLTRFEANAVSSTKEPISRSWKLYGVFPSRLDWGGLDNADEGDMSKLSVLFSVDHMVPEFNFRSLG